MGPKVIYIFSHDSIGLGEDGPTHQPIEQLAGLRAIPNLNVFRPADINETLECWEQALKTDRGPSALALSRQKLPYVNKNFSDKNKCSLGGYELNITSHDYKIILIASGSEVEIALQAQKQLKEENIDSKVVSMPCQEIFDKQDESYKEKILETETCSRIVIEAGSMKGWSKYIDKNSVGVGLETFGKSAPYKQIYNHFDITSDKIVQLARKLLKK